MGIYIKNVFVAVTVLSFLALTANAQTAPHPGVKNCPRIAGPSGPTADHQCENAYKAKLDAYNAEQAQIAAAEAAKKSAASSTQLLSQIEQQNLAGQSKQQNYQTAFQIASAVAAMKFYSTCPKCAWPYMAASIAASVAASQSGKQAGNHNAMALSACGSYNQIASAGKPCAAPITPTNPNNPSFPNQEIDPVTGMCRASAPPSCTTTRAALLADKSFDQKLLKPGVSGFPGVGNDYKVNPDGTITLKDGKILKASDFADEKSMIAAGMSPQDAALAATAAFGKDGLLAKLNKNLADDLKKSKVDFGAFGAGDGAAITVKTGGGAEAGALGSKDVEGSRKRMLASDEGLVKDFNGDAIGISNDDIFRMMNKRYILKSAQDTFLGQ